MTSPLSGEAKIAQILREFLTFMYSLFEMCCPSLWDWVGKVRSHIYFHFAHIVEISALLLPLYSGGAVIVCANVQCCWSEGSPQCQIFCFWYRVNKKKNHFFLENKVVVNFDFRHGAKKSGQSGHPFRSYGYL